MAYTIKETADLTAVKLAVTHTLLMEEAELQKVITAKEAACSWRAVCKLISGRLGERKKCGRKKLQEQ